MTCRPSQARRAKQAKISDWAELPATVFADLGVDRGTLAAFEDALVGSVLLPGEADYESASRAAFQMSSERPKIIVYCEIEADVRLCLAWARRHN